MRKRSLISILLLNLIAGLSATGAGQTLERLRTGFAQPPDDSRIMMRWWWFGPTVVKPELEREMRLMKEGGIGGFEVQPVYPLVLDSDGFKTLPYLSDEFIDALRFTAVKAKELGLRFDLTLGSGWPYGGPMVSIDNAAGRLRYEHVKVDSSSRVVKVPSIGAGEKLLGVFLVRTEGPSLALNSIRELTSIKDDLVKLPDVSAGQYELQFFISSRTGMQVKRAAVGAEGFVLDHLSRAATDMYLRVVGDRLMEAFPNQPPHAIFCDSLEVYGSDWSPDFLNEFKKRRGYDLRPLLPALVNEMGSETRALRRDWGLTLTELLNERFLSPVQQWARLHHTLFRVQDYGVPAAALSSNAYADLPEGEGPQWKTLSATRWASSASHIFGHSITSSETWTWLHSPVFRATPLDMKAEADRHFLEGINQLIGHGWPYTAPGIEYPGWRFYAAAVFDEKNPWWIVMPDVAHYLRRVSFVLRQGMPISDVAIYLPNDDAYASFTPGNVNLREVLGQRIGPDLIPNLISSGYNFDFFDDESFRRTGSVDKDRLLLGQNRYQAIILPNVESISPDVYLKFEEFARNGGTLIATRRKPSSQPGYMATQADHENIGSISRRLFDEPNSPGRFIENEATQLADELGRRVIPDIAFSARAGEVGFIHRRLDDGEVYFLANTSNMRREFKAGFRVPQMNAESWNPLDGVVEAEMVERVAGQSSTITMTLAPYESKVIVFSKVLSAGRRSYQSGNPSNSIDLSDGWSVTFGDNPKPVTYDHLHSWTDDEATRFFSGTASYEKVVTVPNEMVQGSRRAKLEFGTGSAVREESLRSGMQAWFAAPVRESAVVYVNSQRAGSVWCPPYSIEVGSLLHSGENRIRVVVANTAMNYMSGHSLPDYRLLNLRYGERFQAQDMDKVRPVISGLLGPITLTSEDH